MNLLPEFPYKSFIFTAILNSHNELGPPVVKLAPFKYEKSFFPRHMKSEEGLFWKSKFQFASGLGSVHAPQKTKRSFFREKIDENKGSPKGIWKVLKSLSGTNKPRVRINEIVTENGVVGNEASIANELNKYFVNILEQICKDNKADVEFDNTRLTNFIFSRLNADTFYIIPLLTSKQTIGIIEKISSNKAHGYDGISVRILKKIAPGYLQIHYANYLIGRLQTSSHCIKEEHAMI